VKRQILFIGYDELFQAEISEFLSRHGGVARFAGTASMAIQILGEHPISTVVLSMQHFGDTEILQYLNDHYPDIKILLSAVKEFDDIINVFCKGRFSLIDSLVELEELGKVL
jgi:DNA-binding NtrC family response regulator